MSYRISNQCKILFFVNTCSYLVRTGPLINGKWKLEIRSTTLKLNAWKVHYNDVIMGAIASQITSLTIVFSSVYLDTDQRKHQGSAPMAFVRGIHRRPVNSPHKWPVTRKMFPFDDVIMNWFLSNKLGYLSCYGVLLNTCILIKYWIMASILLDTE